MLTRKRARTAAATRPAKTASTHLEVVNLALHEQIAKLQEENARLVDEVIRLKADRDAAADAKGIRTRAEATLTEGDMQGRGWKDLFVSSDVFREHIAPKLGETWTALLKEACGQARSVLESKVERKTMNTEDATQSVSILRWCIDRGYRFSAVTARKAASQGNLDVLKYLHANGCPWDEDTCKKAAKRGYMDVLKYAHENGCPWDFRTCRNAAIAGHLDVIKYARENGCPCDRSQCRRSASCEHEHIVAWIDAQPGSD